jgi:hypothetical protein
MNDSNEPDAGISGGSKSPSRLTNEKDCNESSFTSGGGGIADNSNSNHQSDSQHGGAGGSSGGMLNNQYGSYSSRRANIIRQMNKNGENNGVAPYARTSSQYPYPYRPRGGSGSGYYHNQNHHHHHHHHQPPGHYGFNGPPFQPMPYNKFNSYNPGGNHRYFNYNHNYNPKFSHDPNNSPHHGSSLNSSLFNNHSNGGGLVNNNNNNNSHNHNNNTNNNSIIINNDDYGGGDEAAADKLASSDVKESDLGPDIDANSDDYYDKLTESSLSSDRSDEEELISSESESEADSVHTNNSSNSNNNNNNNKKMDASEALVAASGETKSKSNESLRLKRKVVAYEKRLASLDWTQLSNDIGHESDDQLSLETTITTNTNTNTRFNLHNGMDFNELKLELIEMCGLMRQTPIDAYLSNSSLESSEFANRIKNIIERRNEKKKRKSRRFVLFVVTN